MGRNILKAEFAKLNNEIFDDKVLSANLIKDWSSRIWKRSLKKGKKPINAVIQLFDQHSDDFVRNRTTVRLTFNEIKVPRFANPLYK